ncbi:MAG: tetratricopeptide repeat-containing glycosyltransferase family protein [Proteobacteria bacterium]|nr:tetratricopeptide repeat-containing glycosyltransferase family protein [Pseudomonadota bacterium]
MADFKAPNKTKRTISATLKPVAATPVAAASAPATPTAEQVATWQALKPDQKLALREREAVRMFGQGLEHHQKGEIEEAARIYSQALILNPNFPDIYNNLGVALRALGKLEASAACYQRSLALNPNNGGSYTNLGNVLRALGRLDIAAASHRRAIELTPETADAHYNLGLALRDLGHPDEALQCFAKTLELSPNHPDCHWDRSLALLQKGALKDGFAEYEWRWKQASNPPRGFEQPEWDGAELGGKTILLHQEQGFGDMIQFARYIPMVKERGATIIVEAQPQLSRLFSTIDGVGQVINRGSDLPKFDVYAPIMSLARIFGTTLDTVPAPVPYLKAPDAHAQQLPASLSKKLKVGIAWAGRPTHKNDANRSCSFSHFTELMGLADVSFYSLQIGPSVGDIAAHGCEAFVTELGSKMNDFADTAAVVQQLDLVISVDTAVAHLAGALGKPVWVAAPYPGDWRWMLEREDSPWYPTLRLFRQPGPGDWTTVFETLRRALTELAAGHQTE